MSRSEAPQIDRITACTIQQLLINNYYYHEENNHKSFGEFGTFIQKDEKKIIITDKDISFVKDYIDFNHQKNLEQDTEQEKIEKHIEFKKVYITNRNIDKGNIAHYYLSFIFYGTNDEKKLAKKRTISYYGNLVSTTEIEKLITKVNKFIVEQEYLFSKKKWTNIFTEHTIYSSIGAELRLDRMMVDEHNKEIYIVDYKTGEIYTQNQIDQYIEAIKSKGIVKKNNYKVDGDFFIVEI